MFKRVKELPFEELKSPALENAFMLAFNELLEVNVVATMSAGKSTLINALLGKRLMPSKQGACTATITKIRDDDKTYKADVLYKSEKADDHYSFIDYKTMKDLNANPKVSEIDISGDIPFVESKEVYDNGEGYQMEAEVSFSSGEGYDYIRIDALSVYGGHYIADFYGTLDAPISDGSYPAYDENYGTYIFVTFYEGGMNIWVSESSTDYDTYSLLGGDYTLTEALDLNNVG